MPEKNTLTESDVQNMSESELLMAFVEQLILEKGGVATEEAKAQLLEALNEKINVSILNAMPDASLERLNALLDSPEVTNQQIDALINESGVNTDEVVEKAMIEFRTEYLDGKENR